MIVLGLDASLDRIGWGTVRVNGGEVEPLACGCETVRPGGKHDTPDAYDHRRPELVRAVVRGIMALGVDYFAEPSESVAVYLEAPYVGQNPQTAVGLCMAVGSAWQAVDAVAPNVPAQLLAPDEWKRLAGVPATPRDPENRRRTLKGVALRHYAAELSEAHCDPSLPEELLRVKPEKPLVYLQALVLGFEPEGSQDAADGGLIAVAGAAVNAEHMLAAV